MRNHVTDQFPHGDGPAEDVLTDFGMTRQAFVRRLREILLQDPPVGLADDDVAHLLAVCT
jgi:hypothetical protein